MCLSRVEKLLPMMIFSRFRELVIVTLCAIDVVLSVWLTDAIKVGTLIEIRESKLFMEFSGLYDAQHASFILCTFWLVL